MNITIDTIKFYLIVVCVLFATGLAWYTNGKSLIGIDDANIYMVYMKNFSNGHGFVYNVGGERVEGFTSLLWTLIGSVSFFSMKQSPEFLLLIINIIIITYALWKLVCYIDSYFEDKRLITPPSLFLMGALISIPGYFEWTVLSLMETGLWSSLLILISLNLLDSSRIKGRIHDIKFYILILLLILCRPEAMLWGMWFIMAKFFFIFAEEKSIKKSILLTFPALVVFIASILSLIVWREFYFGFPVPNTFYAKVSSDWMENILAGVKYIFVCFKNNPLSLLSLLLVIGNIYAVGKLKDETKRYSLFLTGGIVILTFMIPLYTGGDHFGLSRFLQPTLPLILLALILNFSLLKIKINYSLSIILIIVFSFANNQPIYHNILRSSPISHEWNIAVNGRATSEKLNIFFDKHLDYPSQGVIAAGGRAFSYKGFTNDLMGLNNVEMAHASKNKNNDVLKNHASFNKEVFYRQNPDIVWLLGRFVNNDRIDNAKFSLSLFLEKLLLHIHQDSEFSEAYSSVIIKNKYSDYSLAIFASNNFLNTLDENIYSYKNFEFE